ncbi:Ig-like domain-containing protein [Acinetobacter haemolyticus]|nr:Ig-like domain-containing protein [Acinetobacter haemolyticus]
MASLAGVDGVDGLNGADGKSAYDLYVETATAAGETPLSLTDWLASLKGDTGAAGTDGADGKSAYELYVDATVAVGGTPLDLASWLDSLVGTDGIDGKSAYDLYVETATAAGETPLSLENWLASLAGVDGVDGLNGADGKSAYDLYVETATAAGETPLSLTDWLASLKGDTGAAGTDGADGKSAYELYVDATVAVGGTPLDLASWLDSLVGTDGIDGKSAYDLYVETATAAGETPLSLENWLASLAGVDGVDGLNGADGKSAYDLYVETATAAGETPLSLTDWLASLKGDTGAAGTDGADGKSAYELYVDATVAVGGTPLDLASWLDSLVGTDGIDGKSAYDLYVETATAAGETPLSLENWLASLAGVDGVDGLNGADGKSAYDLYVETATAAGETPLSLTDWLASLKGDTGAAGTDGADGKSAYELYVDATVAVGGTPLDLASWLDSLVGTDGIDGKSAYDLYVETATAAGETPLSLENWLASLAGVDGVDGLNGADGKSAYDLYVETATAAGETPLSLTDWLASLKGDTGAAGTDGADGKSAYELYLQGEANTWFTANPADQVAYEAYVAGLAEGEVALSASDWLEANVAAYASQLVAAGTDTEANWLLSLNGTDGTNGVDGLSAYELYLQGEANTWFTANPAHQAAYEAYVAGLAEGEVALSASDWLEANVAAYASQLVAAGTDTEANWLLSLNGTDGKDAYVLSKPIIIENSETNLSGTAKAGETVVILDGSGHILQEITVAVDGTFTVSPNPLADKIGSIYVTNALGEISDSFTLVGPSIAPDLPVILVNTTTELSGTAEPNAKVVVIADGQTYETIVGSDGTWSFTDINGTFNPLVVEGVSAAIIYAEDSAGNESDPSIVFISENTALVDLIESVVVVDDLNADDVINALELGNDGQIQLDVKLGINAAVGDLISVNGYNYVLNSVDIAAGQITTLVNVREGENILVVTGTNSAGQTERLQDSIWVDTTAGTVTLDSVQPSGALTLSDIVRNDKIINALESTDTVKLVGTAEPGSLLSITVEGITQPFIATADSITGQWSIDLTSAQLDMLADGEVSVTGTATDQAGNTAQLSGSVTLDTQAPSVVISIAEDGIVTVTPTEPLYVDGTPALLTDIAAALIGSVVGSFAVVGDEIQFTPTTSGYYGDITVTLPADAFTDQAGNPAGTATATDLINFAAAPTVLITSDDYSVVAGQTTVITFTFSELVNGFELFDVSTGGAGTLSNLTQDLNDPRVYTAIFTPNETDTLSAEITVPAGSYVSATTGVSGLEGNLPQPIVGDTQAPVAPTVSLLSDTGASPTDGVTSNGTVSVGNLESGANWSYSTDGGTTWLPGTDNTFTLAEGTYPAGTIKVKQTDASGNESSTTSLVNSIVVDTTAPQVTITSVAAGNGIDEGEKAAGYVVTGTAEPNSIIQLQVGGGAAVPVTVDSTGQWVYQVPAAVSNAGAGTVTITATTVDLAGNPSNTATSTATYLTPTFATSINVIAGDNIINGTEDNSDVTINGGATGTSDLSLVYGVIKNSSGTTVLQLSGTGWNAVGGGQTIGSDKQWTSTLSTTDLASLADGTYTIETSVRNTSLQPAGIYTSTFVIDRTVNAPSYTVSADAGKTITNEGMAYTTNDSTPTWSGTGAEPNSTIEIFADGIFVGTAIVAGDGTWSITSNQILADGQYDITMTIKDKAGNTNTGTAHTITVDTVAPIITIDQPIAGDNVLTNIEAAQGLTISGTAEGAEVGQTVTVTVEGATFTTTVALDPETASPVWNLTLTPAQLLSLSLTDLQVLDISATVTDKAGNKSTPDSATVIYKLADIDVLNTVIELSEAGLLNTETISASGAIISFPSGTSTAYLEAPVTELYVNGTPISWTGQNTQELVGSVNGIEAIRISLNAEGKYTVTMSQAIEHGEPSTATDDKLAFDVRVNFANARGDVTESQYITVNVTDDVPVLTADRTEVLTNTYVVEGNAVVKTSADGITSAEIEVDDTIFNIDFSNHTITKSLVDGGTDQVYAYTYSQEGTENPYFIITTKRGELIEIDLETGDYKYSIFEPSNYVTSDPVAVSLGGSNSLLRAANVNVAGLLEFEDSQTFAVQGDGIYAVEIALGTALDIGDLLGTLLGQEKRFTYNTTLENEFNFDVTVTTAFLGIGEGTLRIEAKDNGPLDTYKVNQLLSTVAVTGGLADVLNVGVVPWITIDAYGVDGNVLPNGSLSSVELANVGVLDGLLSGEPASAILVDNAGRSSTLTKLGALEAWSIYGLDGADKIYGGNEGDHLYGGRGNDLIFGNEGNDYLIGGRGNDTLTGGTGSDTFRWEKDDEVLTIGIPTDVVKDFNADSVVSGGDVLDLEGLLNGGGRLGFMPGNLTNYLHFSYDAVTNKTTILISTDGQFDGGYDANTDAQLIDQIIVLEGVNLFKSTQSETNADLFSDYEVIQHLIAQGNLNVALLDKTDTGDTTIITVGVTDTDGDTDSMSINIDTTNLAPFDFNPDNQAPLVFGENSSLLGLVGLDVLSVVNLGEQDIYVYDVDGDLREVEIEFQQGVSVNVTQPTFTWSSRLASELGLQVEVIQSNGVLGLIAPSTTLSITSSDPNQNISNSSINQILATVKFAVQDGEFGIVDGDLLSLDIINAFTISATDSNNLTTTETLGKLLDLDLATTEYRLNENVTLVEGTDESDTDFNQSLLTEPLLIYGYNGDDVITGGQNNDVIYGGNGNDTINGGSGNDLIYGGLGNDVINGGTGLNLLNGGAGADTFVSTSGAQDTVIYDLQANDATGGHGSDQWNNFKVGNTAFDVDADMIDLSELLAGSFDEDYAQSLLENDASGYFSYMAKFIQLEQVLDGSTTDTLVKIDRDGDGATFTSTSLINLNGVSTNLEELLQGGQILY